jgi:hypothetical protein
VIDLEIPPDVTAGHDALGIPDLEGAAEMSGNVLAAVGYPGDVDASRQDDLQERVFAHMR